jgi:hypothetical protein
MEVIHMVKLLKETDNINTPLQVINTNDINNIILQYENNKPICINNYKKKLTILKNNKLKCNFCDRNIQYCDSTNNYYCWIHAYSLL